MDSINIKSSKTFYFKGLYCYKLQPQSGATVDDLLAVLACLDLRIGQDLYDSLPEVTRRHFAAEPQ